ncbi:hypothetical protein [uncultured Sneathia sp.]|uniref:hypothetical protein n=1 Tax=uncultured Sneathia sp. TaxID=278067 RepID=UPI002591397D|nr:hypothetical protein [uncultured Sneathia sp.]
MDKTDFKYQVKKIQQKMNEIEKIQQDLTVKAEDYRKRYLNYLNDDLVAFGLKPLDILLYKGKKVTKGDVFICNLKPVEIKKYKNLDEVLEEIKIVNADNSNLEHFLNEIYKPINNELEISLVKGTYGYYTFDDYVDNEDVLKVVYAPIERIFNTNDIIYKPDLSECTKIWEN